MSLETKGFNELVSKLELMAAKGKVIAKEAVGEGAKVVLEQQRKDAPRLTGSSANALKIGELKTYKSGAYAKIGINKDNWEEAKALYYQHFGYNNKGWNMKKNPKMVTKHVGWMNESFNKCETNARMKIIERVKAAFV